VAPAKLLERRLDLLLLNVVVLFILRAAWESLPGKLALEEVEEHVANSLEIVSPRLLNSLVGGNGGVPGGTSQVLAILVGDMLTLRVLVTLGEAEIDDVDVVTGRVLAANQEVVWLDVSVDDSLFVNLFDAFDELNCDHEDSFEVKVALARLEKVLEGRAEQVHHHHVELVVRH